LHIEIVELTPASLDDAPAWGDIPFSCRYCLYWEDPGGDMFVPRDGRAEALRKKKEWVKRIRAEAGSCGKIAYVDSRPVGYAQFGPPKHFPNAFLYDAGPPGEDAVFLSCLFVPWEEMRGQGIGRALLDAVLDEARGRGAKAVETFARRGGANNPSGPIEMYEKRGFRVVREDAQFPLLRLDL